MTWLDHIKVPDDLRKAAEARDPCEVGRLFLKHLADAKRDTGEFLSPERRLFSEIPTPENFK